MRAFLLVLLVCLASIVAAVSSATPHHQHPKKRAHLKHSKKHILAPIFPGMAPLVVAQCQSKEDCIKTNPKTFCHNFVCVDCLKDNIFCTQNGQCCDGTECVYGRCKKAAKGDPGTFCDKKEDCKAPDQCCVREPRVSHLVSICKPQLDENVRCGPINDFRTVHLGAFVQTACPPCKESLKLECRPVGHGGYHVCQKPDAK